MGSCYLCHTQTLEKLRFMFALVDCNNFFCSCEKALDPSLKNLPVIVLSNNDGCVVSRSDEARALGISMGIPLFKIKDLVKMHNVQVFSSNFELYGDLSKRVSALLKQYVEVEIYSIDESFLNFSNIEINKREELAKAIRKKILDCLGIPVSIGIASTKTLAKVANHYVKRSERAGFNFKGVFDFDKSNKQEEVLKSEKIGDVWGVGRANLKKLMSLGITNAFLLKEYGDVWASKGSIVEKRLIRELRGESCLRVNSLSKPRKTAVYSRTFGKSIDSKEDIRSAISTFTIRALTKVRKENLLVGAVSIYLRTDKYKRVEQRYLSATKKLNVPTNLTNELVFESLRLLDEIWETNFLFRKASVVLWQLTRPSALQIDLLDQRNRNKESKLNLSIDLIKNSMGEKAIFYGVQAHFYQDKIWKPRSSSRSPRYTTRWNELLTVRT